MRILQILPELNIGGVERGVCDLSKALVKKGHESYVISNGGKLERSLVESGGIHISMPIHIKRFKTLKLADDLYKVIHDINPDIVHVHSTNRWRAAFRSSLLKAKSQRFTGPLFEGT